MTIVIPGVGADGGAMDATRFDALVRGFAAPRPRRSLIRFLAALPLLGGLGTALTDDAAGKGHRQRRPKAQHDRLSATKKHKKKKRKKKKKACAPQSMAQTCAGTCGSVSNNCGAAVDCGPCTCDGGCPACQICDEQTGDCNADPAQQGEPCGTAGQVCQASGACACDAVSCPDEAPICLDGSCRECVIADTCPPPSGLCREAICTDDSQCCTNTCFGGQCIDDNSPSGCSI